MVVYYAKDSILYNNRDCNFIADLHYHFNKTTGITCPVVDRRIPRLKREDDGE
jgi:hypothetical protein